MGTFKLYVLRYRGGVVCKVSDTSIRKAKEYFKKEFNISRLNREKYWVSQEDTVSYYVDNYDTMINGVSYKQRQVSL